MKVSTKGRYGVLAMLALCIYQSKGPVAVREVSSKLGISSGYLEQIFSSLRNAGILESIRGPHGGYLPSATPSKISVGEVLRILEGPLSPVKCVDGDDGVCKREDECITRGVWEKMGDTISSTVDSITFGNLMKECPDLQIGTEHMYYI